MVKFCSNCKRKNPDYSKLCVHCAHSFESVPELKEEKEYPWMNPAPAEEDLSLFGAPILPSGPALLSIEKLPFFPKPHYRIESELEAGGMSKVYNWRICWHARGHRKRAGTGAHPYFFLCFTFFLTLEAS